MKLLYEDMSIMDFESRFPDDKSCHDYLMKLKWPNGFMCRYCKHNHYCSTLRYGEHRCTKCRKVESTTAHTLFHKVKFGIRKAFYMVYFISTNKKGISAAELSRKIDVQKRTAWAFKRKVMKAMASSENQPMDGYVEVDETFVGGYQEGKVGRSQSNKDQVVIGIQRSGYKGISRAYALRIENCGSKQLLKFFDKFVDQKAQIKTDKWRGYTPIQNKYSNLVQIPSKRGENFKTLHRFIMGLKSWLRGIHHHVTYIQEYLNEYTYRFNRHFMKGAIFDNLINRMQRHQPVLIKNLSIDN